MSTKKILSAITTLAVVVMMIAPIAPAGAATADELAKSIADAIALLNSLNQQLATMQSSTPSVPDTTGVTTGAACSGVTFSRNLTIGSRGNDVKCLQTILNASADTQVATSGVGSYGNETTYFGALTKAAVVKYQAKNSISPTSGFVGPLTRAKLNGVAPSTPSATLPAGCTSTSGYSPTTGQSCATGAVVTPVLPAGCTSTSGYSPTTGQSCGIAVPAASTTPITGEGLKVSVAANTPVTNTVITGSEATAMLNITLANGNNTAVKVTKIRLKRSGISGDTSLGNVYLFDGYKRLSDEATLSSGYATFNKSTGIVSIPAGTIQTISVKAQISGTSGETVNLSVEAATDIVSDASAVSGTFPLTGNTMSIADATSKAAVNFATISVPATNPTFNAANNSIMWQDSLTATNQDVKIEYLKFSQIGSVAVDALANIRLDMNGVTLATGQLVASDVGQDLIFDLSAAPVAVAKGLTKTLTIYADVIKGSSKTIRMSIEKSADVFIKDASYGNYVLITVNSLAFTTIRGGLLTVSEGTITMSKRVDSPTTGGVLGATGVSLAKYDIKASGEDVKVNNLRISAQISSATASKNLRNVSLYLNGVQVGNTANIETQNGATTYSTVNIYQILTAGVTNVLEVKGDIYSCTTSACSSVNGFIATESVKIRIEGGDLDNAQGMTSLSMVDAPTGDVDGNTITIGSGSLTLVKSAGYGNQVTAAGRDTKIGQYSITAAQYDGVNISSMTVKVTDAVAALAADMSNLYLKYYGSGVTGTITSSVVGSITSAASNVFSVPVVLPASGTLTVEVWAMVNTTATDADAADTSLAISATRATDGGSADKTAVTGQRATIANGALTVTKASDTPVAGLVVGATNDVLISKYTWSSNYEPFTVTDIKIEATTSPADTSDDYYGIYLKYKDASGGTVTSATMTLINGTTTFTNQTLYVPANSTAYMEVYGNMNSVGSGFADSGDRPQLGLYYYKATSGSTSSAEVTYGMGSNVYGNQMALYASKPTVSLSGATAGTLSNGTMSLYAATIAADAQGAVGLKKLTFSVSPSMSGGGDTVGDFTLYRGSADITSLVTIYETTSTGTDLKTGDLTSVTTGVNVVVTFTDEEEIAAGSSQTYTLKAAITGVDTGDAITTYLKKDSAYVAPAVYDAGTFNAKMFVWTDQSVLNHSEATADWNNSYLVKTLDSPSYTIYK